MTIDLGRIWDVIVIGAGIGGGVVGRRLAEAGLSVLFVEKGPYEPEIGVVSDQGDPAARLARGLWPAPFCATIDGRAGRFFGPVGASVGGTSTFYAAVLERPERHDIDDVAGRPHPTGGWPISYNEMQSYFVEAERIFEVCGMADPLSPNGVECLHAPPPLAEQDRVMAESFRLCGLHPYHIHIAARFLPGCEHCFGTRCARRCKMDGRTAGVEPALDTGRAALLDLCDVKAIHAGKDRVTHIRVARAGEEFELRARNYVLAAGGLGSPRLLLASRNDAWPNGIGNQNDLVGRNLMFHLMELIAVWPGKGARSPGPSKALALRDFYFVDGQRLGIFQAMGVDASYGIIFEYLKGVFDRSKFARLYPLRALARIPAYLAERLFGSAKIFSATIEDLPYWENRVLLDPDDPETLRFEYGFAQELHDRRKTYRDNVKRRMHRHRTVFLSIQPELNLAHGCGTLRFGHDPATSVLDVHCRVHGVQNLYVADASFMPSSMGINPSLTIAANALRVADWILASCGGAGAERANGGRWRPVRSAGRKRRYSTINK